MSNKELNAYIDESGDEGFKEGASQWFIISAVVVDKNDDRDVAHAIDNIKNRLWGEITHKPLHWTKLKHNQKQVVIQELCKHNFTILSVAFEKKHLAREKFDSKYSNSNGKPRCIMYFYAIKFLVERICKYAARQGAIVNLIFENRSSISYEELSDYLKRMTEHPGPYGRSPTIQRGLIKSLKPENKETKKLLQVADACSGALKDALEINRYGNVDESYLMGLIDKFDRVEGKICRIGLKFFPRDKMKLQKDYNCYDWLTKIN